MIKSDELKGPSCLTRAADDEPLFVVRANDELAPALVRDWATRYMASKGGPAYMTDAQLEKFREAHILAVKMEQWHLEQAKRQA